MILYAGSISAIHLSCTTSYWNYLKKVLGSYLFHDLFNILTDQSYLDVFLEERFSAVFWHAFFNCIYWYFTVFEEWWEFTEIFNKMFRNSQIVWFRSTCHSLHHLECLVLYRFVPDFEAGFLAYPQLVNQILFLAVHLHVLMFHLIILISATVPMMMTTIKLIGYIRFLTIAINSHCSFEF